MVMGPVGMWTMPGPGRASSTYPQAFCGACYHAFFLYAWVLNHGIFEEKNFSE